MLLVKTALCFRGLQLSNLCFLFCFFLTSCLVSIHPNQNPNCRNVQADDICSDLSVKLAASDSWRKIKDVPSIKKKKKRLYAGWEGILADLSNTTDAQVRGLRGCVL